MFLIFDENNRNVRSKQFIVLCSFIVPVFISFVRFERDIIELWSTSHNINEFRRAVTLTEYWILWILWMNTIWSMYFTIIMRSREMGLIYKYEYIAKVEHHIVILIESQNGNIMNKQQNKWQMTMWHENNKNEFNDEVKLCYDIHHLPIFMPISNIRHSTFYIYLYTMKMVATIIIIISQFHLSVDWLR